MSISLIIIIVLVEIIVILAVVLGVSLKKMKRLKMQLDAIPPASEPVEQETINVSSNQQTVSLEVNDDVGSSSLLEQQSKTIEHLKAFINDLLAKLDPKSLPNNELETHFSQLEQDNIQLEHCIMVLEDENGFLRDQIEALLRLEK